MNVREPAMMSFMSTSLGCGVCQTKKAVLFRGIFLRAVCCSDTQGWLGFPWPLCPRGGGLKRALRSPGRYAAGRCRLCSSGLTRRSQCGGSGCQGCAAQRSTTSDRSEPGLDAGASGAYIASPFKAENRSGQMQARGAAPELRPPARPPRPWEAFHGFPIAAHSPAVKDQSNHNPFRLAGVRGRPAPRVEASPRQPHQARACAFRSGSDPQNPLRRGMGGDRNQWHGQSAAAPVLSA